MRQDLAQPSPPLPVTDGPPGPGNGIDGYEAFGRRVCRVDAPDTEDDVFAGLR